MTTIPPYTHLILSGGGMCGMVYIGIYRLFQQYNVLKNIHYITGTSIGSLFAFLFGMNIEYEFIEKVFTDTVCVDNETTQFDPNNIFHLYKKNGMYSTERFRSSIVKLLKHKYDVDDITFAEYIKLTGIDIHIHATCLNTYTFIDLCNDTYPEMSVITAMLASMSVPFFFEPVIYKDLVLVDGGCCANMQLYDILKNPYNKVLNIYLTTETPFTKDVLSSSFMAYSSAVMLTLITSHTKRIIVENKEKMDVLELCETPLSFMNIAFKKCFIYATLEKCELEECIIFGYVQMNNFFESKGYLSQTSKEHPSSVQH